MKNDIFYTKKKAVEAAKVSSWPLIFSGICVIFSAVPWFILANMFEIRTDNNGIYIESTLFWDGFEVAYSIGAEEALRQLGHNVADGDVHQIIEETGQDWETSLYVLIDEQIEVWNNTGETGWSELYEY